MSKLLVGLVVMALLCSNAIARDLLPLRHGIYIDRRAGCAAFGGAYSLVYDGQSLSSWPVAGQERIVAHHGRTYLLADRDTDYSDPSTPVTMGTSSETVTIRSDHAFTLTKFGTANYRWCAASLKDLWPAHPADDPARGVEPQ